MDIAFIPSDSAHGPFLADEAVAIGVWQGGTLEAPAEPLDARSGGRVGRSVSLLVATTKALAKRGDTALVAAPAALGAGWLTLVALGDRRAAFSSSDVERLGASVSAALWYSGARKAVLVMNETPQMAAHLAMGIMLRCAEPPSWRQGKKHPRDTRPSLKRCLIAVSDPHETERLFSSLRSLADSILLARRLAMTPANLLNTRQFCDEAEKLTSLGVDVEILNRKELEAQGLNLLHAVGRGSRNPPRLVCLRWKGEGSPRRPVALVGKGIVFDTGGISVKPATHMEEMKGDMAGAASVLAALRTMALCRAPVHAMGILAIAENAVSERATRPGDIVTAFDGKTIEIIDTDAEGRLVLADALAWTCLRHRPTAIVSIATLTGAVVATLGRRYAGMMSGHDALAGRLSAAARQTGEEIWRLPFDPAYKEALKSPIADLRNCSWGPGPDAVHAAIFLSRFISKETRWAHLDIAGTSEAVEDLPLCPKGATGFGVRLLNRWVELEQRGRS